MFSASIQIFVSLSFLVEINLCTIFRGDKAINCASLISLVKKQSAGMFQSLPTAAKRSLLKSLVIVGTANKQEGVKDRYWEEVSFLFLNNIFLSKLNYPVFL